MNKNYKQMLHFLSELRKGFTNEISKINDETTYLNHHNSFDRILLFAYKLPYYVYKPGGADALDSIVKVDDGYTSEGQMHLVTVRGGQATPIQYLLAKFLPHQDIVPIEDIRPEGITEDEYFHAQLQMMESSQEASTVVAYEAANANVNIDYEGVYIVG